MRLWTINPKYLDRVGLVALWREALLARAVLCGETRGYRHHPQLERFKLLTEPRSAIHAYLSAVFNEAASRGYSFDQGKLEPVTDVTQIAVTSGQIEFEWQHLLVKLAARSPSIYERWRSLTDPELHPIFRVMSGEVAPRERGRNGAR